MAATRPDRTLLLSRLLDLHLDRAIKRYRDAPRMSKFLQLADDIESDLREFDEEADLLQAKRLANKERGRQLFEDHHRVQDRIADGFARMEGVIHDMGGSNSRPLTAEQIRIAGEKQKALLAAKVGQNLVTSKEEPPPEAPKLGEGSEDASGSSFQSPDGDSGAAVGGTGSERGGTG